MASRALVLGSQIEGLRGVDCDARRMAALLDARGFAVDLRLGAAATRAGILAGYDRLLAASEPDDAAVVYYCGHGYYAAIPDGRRSWQCIAPSDLRASTATDWRGITAWELSIRQAQLTAKTCNVTVILDCCHAAQLSRSDAAAGATPRALPHPVDTGFDHHLAALRASYGAAFDAVDPAGDSHAVRVVACGQTEAAFEYPDDAGDYHGAFSDALIDVLTQVGDAPVSWAAIIGAIRARVLRRFARQRPDAEGPVHRLPFSLAEHDLRSVAITPVDGRFRLSAGRLTGAAVGDVYRVVPAGSPIHDDSHALAQVEVAEVFATTALAQRTTPGDALPAGAIAVPIRRCAPRWLVAIAGLDADPDGTRADVAAEIARSPTLRVAQPGEPDALATLRLTNGAATLEDAGGPLFPPARLPAELGEVLAQLANLGVAQGLRELEGEHGVRAAELAIELGIVRDGRARRLPDHGAVLGLGDRYCVTVERRGQRTLFVHLLNISARGKILLLTQFDRGGVVLDRHHPSVTIGQGANGALVGVGLRWPDGMPASGLPRLTEFVVVAAPAVTDLSGLETREAAVARSDASELQHVLAQLCGGAYRNASCGGPLDGFFLKRLSILLAPPGPPDAGITSALD